MEAEHEDRAQERALRDRRLLHVRAAADRDADAAVRAARVDRDRVERGLELVEVRDLGRAVGVGHQRARAAHRQHALAREGARET